MTFKLYRQCWMARSHTEVQKWRFAIQLSPARFIPIESMCIDHRGRSSKCWRDRTYNESYIRNIMQVKELVVKGRRQIRESDEAVNEKASVWSK